MTPFRLASLLRLRTAQQDQAAAELARSAGLLLSASDRARRDQDALGSHRTPASCSSVAWTASVAARAALTVASMEARVVELEHEAAVATATVEWHGTRRRTTALDHLRERHDEAVARERRAAEQLQLDEHTAATFGRHDDGSDR